MKRMDRTGQDRPIKVVTSDSQCTLFDARTRCKELLIKSLL